MSLPVILIHMQMRTIAQAVLDRLAEAGPVMIDALIPPHHKSRAARALLGLDHRRYASRKAEKHSFSTVLGRLRREGLVARRGTKRNSLWTITSKGKIALKEIKGIQMKKAPILPPSDGIIRLVSFDIPEKMHLHRRWLRAQLLACDFDPLHKSVLIGKRPLPEECIAEMETRGLTKYIHIVSIQKSGTLTREI